MRAPRAIVAGPLSHDVRRIDRRRDGCLHARHSLDVCVGCALARRGSCCPRHALRDAVRDRCCVCVDSVSARSRCHRRSLDALSGASRARSCASDLLASHTAGVSSARSRQRVASGEQRSRVRAPERSNTSRSSDQRCHERRDLVAGIGLRRHVDVGRGGVSRVVGAASRLVRSVLGSATMGARRSGARADLHDARRNARSAPIIGSL